MGKPQRIKTAAAEFVPATRFEADEAIRVIGEHQRKREVIQTALNDRLAAVKAELETLAAPIAESIKVLGHGVQVWAEANRVELTRDGKTKTVKLGNGEISWRFRPPSVTLRAAGLVIEALKRLGLDRFIRTKEEIDREAILREPAAVQDVKGIAIAQGEDFCIKPFATELEEVA
jgi:phage host-nuclease inhibitor protein Gam